MPEVCRIEDFMDYKSYIVKSINAGIPIIFKGIKGMDEHSKIKAKNLIFKSSLEENTEATGFGFGTALVILAFFILLGLFIAGTVVEIIKKRNKRI